MSTTINGGTSWQASGLFTALAPGTYDVRIRDAANTGCVIILNAGLQITQPAVLSGTVIDTDITCFGANDGVIKITNSAGGYGTYQYSIRCRRNMAGRNYILRTHSRYLRCSG